MSVTYISGKKAGAFYLPNGELVYLLCEKSRESNISPSIASWGLAAICSHEDAINFAVSGASACVGLSLQGEGRRQIKPENYIAGWRREMKQPGVMHLEGRSFNIDYKRQKRYFENALKNKERAHEILLKHQRTDLIQPMLEDNETITLNFDVDAALIVDLYRRETGVLSAYHAFTRYMISDETMTIDVPETGKSYVPPDYQLKALPNGGMLLKIGESVTTYIDYSLYACERDFVTNILAEAEKHHEGISKTLTQAFRVAMQNAPQLSPDASVTICVQSSAPDYIKDYVRQLDATFPLQKLTDNTYRINVSAFDQYKEAYYPLYTIISGNQEYVQCTWDFATEDAISIPPTKAYQHQLSMQM